MTEAPQIDLSLFRQQSLAFTCPAQEICYGGAAGGGKSHLLRSALIAWALAVPGLQCYLFRRKYPDLVRNHLEGPTSFHVMLQPLIKAGLCKIVKGEIRFRNGSRIYLRHLQHTKEVYSYQGAEIHVLAFDEGTHFTDFEYRYLRGRCRVVGLDIPEGCQWEFPRVLVCTNPGGVGHHWVKAGFIDHGEYVIHRSSKKNGGMTRCFIPAKMDDNPALLEADPDYIDRLDGLGDAELVRALKEGDWDVVSGSMFGGIWRRARHVCQPFAIPEDWPIWIGIDDGFTAPAAVVWMTRDPDNGTEYCIRELYRSNMLPADMARRIKKIHAGIIRVDRHAQLFENGERDWSGNQIVGLMDAASFAKTGQAEIPRGRQLQKLGIKVQPVEKWAGSRVAGAQDLHRALSPNPKTRDGRPGLQFFNGMVPNLIRTIPTLPRDESNPEDVDTDAEDHLYDGLRYARQHRRHRLKRRRTKGV